MKKFHSTTRNLVFSTNVLLGGIGCTTPEEAISSDKELNISEQVSEVKQEIITEALRSLPPTTLEPDQCTTQDRVPFLLNREGDNPWMSPLSFGRENSLDCINKHLKSPKQISVPCEQQAEIVCKLTQISSEHVIDICNAVALPIVPTHIETEEARCHLKRKFRPLFIKEKGEGTKKMTEEQEQKELEEFINKKLHQSANSLFTLPPSTTRVLEANQIVNKVTPKDPLLVRLLENLSKESIETIITNEFQQATLINGLIHKIQQIFDNAIMLFTNSPLYNRKPSKGEKFPPKGLLQISKNSAEEGIHNSYGELLAADLFVIAKNSGFHQELLNLFITSNEATVLKTEEEQIAFFIKQFAKNLVSYLQNNKTLHLYDLIDNNDNFRNKFLNSFFEHLNIKNNFRRHLLESISVHDHIQILAITNISTKLSHVLKTLPSADIEFIENLLNESINNQIVKELITFTFIIPLHSAGYNGQKLILNPILTNSLLSHNQLQSITPPLCQYSYQEDFLKAILTQITSSRHPYFTRALQNFLTQLRNLLKN